MIGVLIFIYIFTIARTLEPQKDENDEDMKIFTKYMSKIPDYPPKYVIHDGIRKLVSKFYKDKVNIFPLVKIQLKIDRKPVRIPWTLGTSNNVNDTKAGTKKYTYVKVHDPDEPKTPNSK